MAAQTGGNLWRASSTVSVEAPQLAADARADLVIIGGGFTGNAAALEAARRGASVVLLEAETIGRHGGSGRNVGLVNAGLWLPPQDVIKLMGREPGLRLVDILAQAPALVWSLVDREEIECEATRNGTLHLAHSPAGFRDLAERHRQGVELGAPLQLLDAEETKRRTGSIAFHGSLFDPRAGTIQPLSYARGLAAAAIRAGAKLHGASKGTRVTHDGEGWQVTANGHVVKARSLLLATNAYFNGIELGTRPQFVKVGYSQFATAPMPEHLRKNILAGGEGCWDTAMVMSSFRIDRASRIIVGGIGNEGGAGGPVHASWARRKLRQVYPQLADLPFEHAWHGHIAMTGDHVPKILRLGPSGLACFGYSGRGIGPGTVFGTRAAIALLDGREDELPVEPVEQHVERFVEPKALYYETGAVLTHAINPPPFS